MKDVKPVFIWAKEYGDANIYDRIIMKILPNLLDQKINLTSNLIDDSKVLEVSDELFELILQTAQELTGEKYV